METDLGSDHSIESRANPDNSPLATLPARALVVGINEYESPRIKNLTGAVPDALAVAAFLRERAGMSETQIRLLTSPAQPDSPPASRAEIIRGFQEFLGAATPGQEVLFYYSGHGSQNHLLPRELSEMLGETLVPADARVNDVPDLLDRELRLLAAALTDKGIRLTLIVDACHAGDVVRGRKDALPLAEPVSRLTPKGSTRRSLASLLDGTVSAERLAEVYATALPGMTLLAAARASEPAFEVGWPPEAPDGRRGALTLALLEALSNVDGPVSYRELVGVIRARLDESARVKGQIPIATGEEGRALFAPTAPDRTNLFVVQSVDAATKQLRLDGGRIHGIEVGSLIGAHERWTLEDAPHSWRVVQAGAAFAIAEAIESDTPLPRPGAPLRLLSTPEQPTLRFAPGTEALLRAWEARVGDAGPVGLVLVSGDEADYSVEQADGSFVVRRNETVVPYMRFDAAEPRSPTRLVGRLARLDCMERMLARVPAADQLLDAPIGLGEGSDGIGLAARRMEGRQRRPLAFDAEAAPLEREDLVELALAYLGSGSRYALLYRIDLEAVYAERLWPQDGSQELTEAMGEKRIHLPIGDDSILDLLLLVSDAPLALEKYPCGRPSQERSERGGDTAPPETPEAVVPTGRWAVRRMKVGRPGGTNE